MKCAVLVSGVPRSFMKFLWPFLNELPDAYDIYILFAAPSYDKYSNAPIDYAAVRNSKNIKYVSIESAGINSYATERENNVVSQWNKLQQLYQLLEGKDYTHILRIRPDIRVNLNVVEFQTILHQCCQTNTIYIPTGYDIYDFKQVSPEQLQFCVNDQVAFGTVDAMRIYCNIYDTIVGAEAPIISELHLYQSLNAAGIHIQRINMPYDLVLSECFTFSICGDSGSGKSCLSQLIRETLDMGSILVFETDRYHKWERGNPQYETYTHLNPYANHLEKLSSDAYKLCLGQNIFQVDYDHSTGRFTEPQSIQPQKYTIFCGLHTLHDPRVCKLMDLKIYLDTDPQLKTAWKIQRDVNERGASLTRVMDTITRRKSDFETFIAPQKQNANIVIRYTLSDDAHKKLILYVQNYLVTSEILHLSTIATNTLRDDTFTVFEILDTDNSGIIRDVAKQYGYSRDLKESFDGIIQLLIILLAWNPTNTCG